MTIREEIDGLDEANDRARRTDNDSDTDIDIQHISIGSRLGPMTLREIEDIHSGLDSAFLNFRKKIIDSLTVIYVKESRVWENVHLSEDHQVMFFNSSLPDNIISPCFFLTRMRLQLYRLFLINC